MNQAATWKPLYRAGAVAALLVALLFRRNIGAEVSLFTGIETIPTTVADWYALLQANPFVGFPLLASDQTVLAGSDPLAGIPGTGALVSLLLVALAGLLFSLVLLPSHHATAILGLLASGCDLVYCLVFPLTPLAPVYLLLAGAGLFWMLWHLLAARILWHYAKE